MTGASLADAIAVYDELLTDADLGTASVQALREGQAERGLRFGEHLLSVAVRPNLMAEDTYHEVVAAAHGVDDALHALERALVADADLRAALGLSEEEERLALAHPGCTASSPASRLDGFLTDALRFIECNAESPAGMAYNDSLIDVFDAMPVVRAFRERFRIRPLRARHHQRDALLRAFREWGGAETPVIAIVDWPGLPTLHEFELFRSYFESEGLRCVITDPASLEFDGKTLWADGEAITLVYRRVLISELIASQGEEHRALRDAYLAGAACVVNTFRAKLLHKKSTFALLTDERYAGLFNADQRAAVAAHVPWTRQVADGPSTRDGERIDDLAAYIVAHQSELVIKPDDEYGGKGVVLGWTVDASEWEQAVLVATREPSVVQAAVGVPRHSYPVALGEAGTIEHLDLAADCDPYVFYGRVGGFLTRLSSSALLNVTAGAGSVVPTYLLSGPR